MKKKRGTVRDSQRKAGDAPMHYRSLSLRKDAASGGPATLDEKNRSVEVIGATEEPVEVFDWERWEVVREVLLMDGLEMPKSRQVPLLDSHSRYSTAAVMGSYRGMETRDGQLTGRAFFSTVPEAENPYVKLREGHLTDFSAGYRVVQSTWIDEGQSAVIRGRSFQGPLRVTERWRIKELSITPIGADELAKVRSEHQPTEPGRTAPGEEKDEMKEKLKKWLVSRGMPEAATDDEVLAFMEKLQVVRASDLPPANNGRTEGQPVDIVAERRTATEAERARVAEIDGAVRAFGYPEDLRQKLVDQGTPVSGPAGALRQIFDWAAANKKTTGGVGHRAPVTIAADERDKFRAAAVDSILLRAPADAVLKRVHPEKPAEGARDLMGYSLREIARHCLVIANQPTGGHPLEMVGRALTTSDLPNILAAGVNRALLAGWESADQTWRAWCGIGSPVNDFKIQTLVRASETSNLDEIPEHGEYKYGKLADSKEQLQIGTYGKLLAITRQAIINDDLGALTETPAKMGEAASRTVGDQPYAVLMANAAMGDGVALFHATHSNLLTGAALGMDALGLAIKAMKLQKDTLGLRRLNIRAEYFIAPVALEGASEVFFLSERFSDPNTVATDSSFASTRTNPYAGGRFTRVYEPRLDDADANGWYLAGRKGMTVNVFFLFGIQTPYLEQKAGWTVDGVELKVRIDVAAKAVDWRGMQKNPGPS